MAEGDGLLNRYTGSNPYPGFESPSLRYCENIAGFTNQCRAGNFRRDIVLGNTAMFFNSFPGSSEIHEDFFVLNSQVRANFFEQFGFFAVTFS